MAGPEDRSSSRTPADGVSVTLVDHTADLAVCISAPDKESVLGLAPDALSLAVGSLVPDLSNPPLQRRIELEADSDADGDAAIAHLLRDLVAELLYELAVNRRTASAAHVKLLSPTAAEAHVLLHPLDVRQSSLDREVKAVTYHDVAGSSETLQSHVVTLLFDI